MCTIFTGFWNLPHVSPTCFAWKKAREITKPCKNCPQLINSNIFFNLVILEWILTSLDVEESLNNLPIYSCFIKWRLLNKEVQINRWLALQNETLLSATLKETSVNQRKQRKGKFSRRNVNATTLQRTFSISEWHS